MTNTFLSKGKSFRTEPGPPASTDHVSPDEGIAPMRFRPRSASGQVPRDFDSRSIVMAPEAADLKTESTGSQVLVI